MILGSEEKSAVFLVLELIQHHVGQLAGQFQVAAAPAGLQELEQGVAEEGVVIEIGAAGARGRL